MAWRRGGCGGRGDGGLVGGAVRSGHVLRRDYVRVRIERGKFYRGSLEGGPQEESAHVPTLQLGLCFLRTSYVQGRECAVLHRWLGRAAASWIE